MKQHKKKPLLYIILFLFLSIKIFHLLTQKGISWDSAVYIGMGKYIFSAANIGLWEPARPLVWPIILGFLWKTSINPIIAGRIAELILSIGCIYVTYLIGRQAFNKNIALLSAFFLAFSPTFLFYSSTILTGIPSTFLALLSIYFLFKKRYFLTGLFLALSFMTRFLQLFIIIPIIIILLKKKNLKNILDLTYGFSIIIIPYLILNTFLYKNPIRPFILQTFMAKHTGWIFHQPLSFYFINILKENFLILFAVIGLILILKQKDYKKITILTIFLLFFLLFSSIAHKEMRFTIVFLPYMYLITSYGLFKTINSIKTKKYLLYAIIIIISLVWLTTTIPKIKTPSYKEYPEPANYLKNNNIKGNIWISNPIFIANSNQKADELIYYPLYNSKKIETLKKTLSEANHILLNTCDILPCPKEDLTCSKKTADFINQLKNNFKTIHYKKESNCEEFIFSPSP